MKTARRMCSTLMHRLSVLLSLGLLASAGVASAASYYVDKNWTGPYNGTTNQPFQTIKAGVDAACTSAAPRNVYIAAGTYADVANSGTEDYSAGGGSDHGILISNVVTVAGGYAGWQGGSTFNWTAASRAPRSTVIDLQGANSRAFCADWPAGNGPSSGPTFDGFTFRNANATGDGGAIFAADDNYWSAFATNCLFTNNVCTGNGGAIRTRAQGMTGWIRNCDFVDNLAATNGGAVSFAYTGDMTPNTIIEDSTFLRNKATNTVGETGRGGAIFWNGNASTRQDLRRCRFESNTAAQNGGALFSRDPWIAADRCTFVSNTAPNGAAVGGISYWCGPVSMTNCLVYGHTNGYAVQAEGARMGQAYTLAIVHSTIVSNSGGGLRARFNDGSNNKPMRVMNSIVAFNGKYGIYRPEDDYQFTNNNVYGNATNYYNCTPDGGSISVDPLFVNAAASDYRLAKGSPSFDAGTNMPSVTIDLAGVPRPTRNGWDQGCYEERGACRIIHQAPVITASNVTLRGQLVYDGGSNDANVVIYWGATDGGKTNTNWTNPGTVGYVTNGGNFQLTITPPVGTSWYRCYVTNWYDGVWADASESFEYLAGAAVVIWTGASTNSLASNPNNWFGGTLPQPQDTVKFDSSPSNCTWDTAAPAVVSKWEQTAAYAGTVTVARAWASGVTVSNHMLIRGGRLTHAANTTQETYRVFFAVGGNLEVAASAAIDAEGKGYAQGKGPGAGVANLVGGTHGGEGYRNTNACYGSVWAPVTLGSGGGGASGRAGGGAVYVTVGGTATVQGVISANADTTAGNYDYGGSGGSVFLRAGVVAGSGTLRANGSGTGHESGGGGGGRVALIVTNSTSFGSLTLTAYGSGPSYGLGNYATAGTVYKQSTAHAAQQGILTIDNNNLISRRARTVIPTNHPLEQFSAIVLSRGGTLGFAPGETFDFGAMGNLTFNGAANSYIAVRDVTGITIPASFTITNYTLRLDAPLVCAGNWTIATNSALSHSPYDGTTNAGLDLTLTGNLTVDGAVDVRGCGHLYLPSDARGTGFTASACGSYGGLGAGATSNKCYGSILRPNQLGSGADVWNGFAYGGGRARLVVSGQTAVNGGIYAGCAPNDNLNAAGGSIDLQTATLTGTGTVSATGGRTVNPAATHSELGGGGGRIRVKLTGTDSFGSVVFAANGGGAGAGSPTSVGAAGTVYLEGASQADGAGRIVIGNASLTKNRATEFPPTQLFSDNLRYATLVITNGAWVSLTTNVVIGDLYMAADSQFNLNGYTCKVGSSKHALGGTPTGPGEVQWTVIRGTVIIVR
jgi:predicted outer membrane repeat protein